jgi:hypothetical protein
MSLKNKTPGATRGKLKYGTTKNPDVMTFQI